MMRILIPVAAIGAAVALAGCNEMAGGAAASPVPSAPAAPAALSLPSGSACANEINRFQSILKGDLETGNVEQKVFDQIQLDLNRAASACSAGKGAEAHRIVARSKASHGYRA